MSSDVVLKKVKKPALDKAKDAATFPWVLRKPYSDDRFFREWRQAQAAVVSDLDALHDQWSKRLIADNVELADAAAKGVREAAVEQPLNVCAVIDAVSGMKYRAVIFRRETL